MHLEPWADASLLIFGAIFSLIAVGALAVLAFAITKIQQQLTKTDR